MLVVFQAHMSMERRFLWLGSKHQLEVKVIVCAGAASNKMFCLAEACNGPPWPQLPMRSQAPRFRCPKSPLKKGHKGSSQAGILIQ